MTAVACSELTLLDVLAATQAALVREGSSRAFSGVSIDSRSVGAQELFVAIRGERFDGHDFLEAAARKGVHSVLVERDVDPPPGVGVLRVSSTTRALGDLARHLRRRADFPVVAITGSTGKTTTKEMTAWLLEAKGEVLKTQGNLNNRYGLPLTLLRLKPEHRFAVVELGMSAPGELRSLSRIAEPDVAVITNVAAVHLEFFGNLDAIAAAKAEILEGLGKDGVAVLNGDDARVRRIGERAGRRVVWFGRDRTFDVSAENWRGTANGMRFDLRMLGEVLDVALPLAGPHFMMNFLAAAAVAVHLGVPPETLAERASEMKPSPHRGEVVRLGEGVTLIDDCYNSNPMAVEAAVVALGLVGQGRSVAFLGDMLELGPTAKDLHRQVGARIAPKVSLVVGVGPLGAEFGGQETFSDAEAAAAAVKDLVRPGDAVLVKGSRGVHMETIVEALKSRFGP